MKRADLSAHDRALLDQVREIVRALGAHVSLELEDRFALLEARLAQLEQLVRERRTVIVRRPKKTAKPGGEA